MTSRSFQAGEFLTGLSLQQLVLKTTVQPAQLPDLRLGFPPLLDVAQDQRVDHLPARLRARKRSLDRKRSAVGTHGIVAFGQPDRRLRTSRMHVVAEHPAQRRGKEAVAGHAQGFARLTAEHAFGRPVEERDAACFVERDDRVHRGLDDAREPLLALLKPGPQALDFQMRGDARQHFLVLERLRDVVDGAEFEPFDLIDGVRQRAHENHRNVARRGVRLEARAGREPVEPGHHHVEQDQSGLA